MQTARRAALAGRTYVPAAERVLATPQELRERKRIRDAKRRHRPTAPAEVGAG